MLPFGSDVKLRRASVKPRSQALKGARRHSVKIIIGKFHNHRHMSSGHAGFWDRPTDSTKQSIILAQNKSIRMTFQKITMSCNQYWQQIHHILPDRVLVHTLAHPGSAGVGHWQAIPQMARNGQYHKSSNRSWVSNISRVSIQLKTGATLWCHYYRHHSQYDKWIIMDAGTGGSRKRKAYRYMIKVKLEATSLLSTIGRLHDYTQRGTFNVLTWNRPTKFI